MVIDLKLCRFESAPWGFRLIGGTDFELPLTVVKVTEGSLADQAGMRVGDIIVRINDEPTCNMTHNDAHDVISKCGNNFFLGVLREDEQDENEGNCNQSEETTTAHEESSVEITSEIQNVSSQFQEHSETSTVEVTYKESCETHEERAEEDVIAEVMSGEAEVLKEHNVIGIFPKAGICQGSEVFRTLNEEAVKTKIELEKEKRKWTTFLQKPDRPIPKSKQDIIEEQIKGEPYRVRIVKQVKPDPASVPTPPPETKHEPEPELPKEPEKVDEIKIEEPLAPLSDTEVPNLESDVAKTCSQDAEKTTEENNNEIEEENEESKSKEDAETTQNEADVKEDSHAVQEDIEIKTVTVEKTEEELLLEKQLESVQQQLLALSSLPSTIQATLDAVTKQLTELLPTFKLQPPPNKEESPSIEGPKEDSSQQKEVNQDEAPIEDIDDIKTDEDIEEIKEILEITSAKPEVPDQLRSPEPVPIEMEETVLDDEQRKMQEELQYKKQKDQKEQLREELEQRLIRDKRPRRPPSAFGPLTPQKRPLILPGGRRWRTPKDAFNDEFIAEVLSSQAELIVGSTLGSTYESPHLGYDEREYNLTLLTDHHQDEVNFLKYQKPEKKIDLEKSEVYKVIHHLERTPRRGIEARPPKVPAEEDIRSRATPMTCG